MVAVATMSPSSMGVTQVFVPGDFARYTVIGLSAPGTAPPPDTDTVVPTFVGLPGPLADMDAVVNVAAQAGNAMVLTSPARIAKTTMIPTSLFISIVPFHCANLNTGQLLDTRNRDQDTWTEQSACQPATLYVTQHIGSM